MHASASLMGRQKWHWKAPHGIGLFFRRLDERFPGISSKLTKMGGSWMICCDCVLQQRMDCCVHRRCRELFEQAAREGIELPSVTRGNIMLTPAARFCSPRARSRTVLDSMLPFACCCACNRPTTTLTRSEFHRLTSPEDHDALLPAPLRSSPQRFHVVSF